MRYMTGTSLIPLILAKASWPMAKMRSGLFFRTTPVISASLSSELMSLCVLTLQTDLHPCNASL